MEERPSPQWLRHACATPALERRAQGAGHPFTWCRRPSGAPRSPSPAAFCAALLRRPRYTLPTDVPAATWELAVQHFAERQPTEPVFRRVLEQRATRD